MKRREYNHTIYRGVKKINGFIRDKESPSVGEPLKKFGVLGKILCLIIDKIIVVPIRFFAFKITGLFYNRETEKPYKGSFIYSFCFIMLMFFAAGAISLII